jgi:D-alanyl-lipoteichoic acid acyltransferase DltB (MBOAT superfamily)
VLAVDVVLNIGVLVAFKYGNQILDIYCWGAQQLGLSEATRHTNILLPVGLSFFTFQSLSYVIDVYRRTIGPSHSLLNFAIFVSFFPVLLAGPLLRAGDFLPQSAAPRRANGEDFGLGMALLTLGLFMKTSLADNLLSPIVTQVFAPNVAPDTLSAWLGTIAFAAQDYCDFAGYATCAMGVSLCLGFTVPENFRAPFASVGFRDLWQRWHITLVAWMRDYVFLSLGGVYKGYRRAAINVLVVFLLIGLWHGATINYLVFGFLHGSFLIVETVLQRSPVRRSAVWRSPPGIAAMWLATMFLCCVAFAFYRSDTLGQSWQVLSAMLGAASESNSFRLTEYDMLCTGFVAECLVICHWLRRNMSVQEVIRRAPWWAVSIALALMLLAITVSPGGAQNFLYFQY